MTQNYSPYPIYYTVTVNISSPTDYSALTGDQSGGIDIGTSLRYNQRVSVTGNVAINTSVMSQGETIVINGYSVAFSSTDLVTDVVNKIALASKYTNVTATNEIATNCVTLTNTVDQMGYTFYVAEGNGTALSKMGIFAGSYRVGVTEYGGSFTNFQSGDVISINGVNIAFTGSTTAIAAAARINSLEYSTGVVASVYGGGKIQLGSVFNQPYSLGGANIASLGFTAGNHGGFPLTLALSESKERGIMRYIQAVNEIEKMATPFYTGSWFTTGNQDGNAAPTTLTFTTAFNQVDYLQTTATSSETDAGTVFQGAPAIRRSVARALVANMNSNRKVFDPTLQSYGVLCDRPNSARIENLTAAPLDVVGNITTVENNITVTQIGNV